MYNIEKYAEGNMDQLSLVLFERRMRRDNKFKQKVVLYQNIDSIMQGAVMASAAEFEMKEKRIDLVAKSFVKEYKQKSKKQIDIKEFLSWS